MIQRTIRAAPAVSSVPERGRGSMYFVPRDEALREIGSPMKRDLLSVALRFIWAVSYEA